jgi:hypothetical protein
MRRDDLNYQVEVSIGGLTSRIKNSVQVGAGARSPADLQEVELQIMRICRELAGLLMGIVLEAILADKEWEEEKIALFKGTNGLRKIERRPVQVKTLSGIDVTVHAEYLAQKKPKKNKKHKRRDDSGVFPGLAALGVMYKCTPALLSDTARQVVESCSVQEARESLARRGIMMSGKKVWSISKAFAADSLIARDRLLVEGCHGGGEFDGQRVVACVDGGRIRTRKQKRKGKKPKGKKQRRYDTDWREPKVLIIYVIDENGKRDHRFMPVIDGTLGNADCVIALLVGHLRLLGVDRAAQLVISGDGARWIWERVGTIIKGVGIDSKKVRTIVDFYHAVEHLQAVADLRAGWGERQRKRWVTLHRRLLRRGKIDVVIKDIASLIGGRNAKKLRTELKYFKKNKHRMRYAWFKRCRLPLGSGAVESCIRRVVNLRMKGASIFWKEDNAEGFLHMRAQFKSGRWDEMVMRTLDDHATPVAA